MKKMRNHAEITACIFSNIVDYLYFIGVKRRYFKPIDNLANLIKIYEVVCIQYDKFLKFQLQRFSNNTTISHNLQTKRL